MKKATFIRIYHFDKHCYFFSDDVSDNVGAPVGASVMVLERYVVLAVLPHAMLLLLSGRGDGHYVSRRILQEQEYDTLWVDSVFRPAVLCRDFHEVPYRSLQKTAH